MDDVYAYEGVGVARIVVFTLLVILERVLVFGCDVLFLDNFFALDKASSAVGADAFAVGSRSSAARAGIVVNDLCSRDLLFGLSGSEA